MLTEKNDVVFYMVLANKIRKQIAENFFKKIPAFNTKRN